MSVVHQLTDDEHGRRLLVERIFNQFTAAHVVQVVANLTTVPRYAKRKRDRLLDFALELDSSILAMVVVALLRDLLQREDGTASYAAQLSSEEVVSITSKTPRYSVLYSHNRSRFHEPTSTINSTYTRFVRYSGRCRSRTVEGQATAK